MVHLLTQLAKYVVLILFVVYTASGFVLLNSRLSDRRRKALYARQTRCMFSIHFICYLVIFVVSMKVNVWLLYAAEVVLVLIIFLIYRVIYKYAERLIINHMCMLLLIGLTMLTRLNVANAVRQLEIAGLAVVISIFIPPLVVRLKVLRRFTWAYAVVGILALGVVLAFSRTSGGAHIVYTIGGITFQPSEFVKILFVFFVACMFYKSTTFKQVLITTLVAALHVLILVASTDLGTATIFFVTYIVMLYVATRKGVYLIAGFGLGAAAAYGASKVFRHVQTRINAWRNPFTSYDQGGYQVAQSLFAIGTGGWFGTGLYQGMPDKIPVGESDFIFACIAEEFGCIFAICLILVCMSCFIIITNVAMSVQDVFFKLIALGFSCIYGVQVILNIGGVIKFIPSTGVTLPFVSYGGSSLLCMTFMFAIIQGIYILRHNEGESNAEKQRIAQARSNTGYAQRPEQHSNIRQQQQVRQPVQKQATRPESAPKQSRRTSDSAGKQSAAERRRKRREQKNDYDDEIW